MVEMTLRGVIAYKNRQVSAEASFKNFTFKQFLFLDVSFDIWINVIPITAQLRKKTKTKTKKRQK